METLEQCFDRWNKGIFLSKDKFNFQQKQEKVK